MGGVVAVVAGGSPGDGVMLCEGGEVEMSM